MVVTHMLIVIGTEMAKLMRSQTEKRNLLETVVKITFIMLLQGALVHCASTLGICANLNFRVMI